MKKEGERREGEEEENETCIRIEKKNRKKTDLKKGFQRTKQKCFPSQNLSPFTIYLRLL